MALAALGTVSGSISAQVRAADQGSSSVVVGTVFDHETGEPLVSALVSLGRGPDGTRDRQTRETDENGNFAFPEVPPGTYVIRASLLGRQTLVDTLSVEANADVRVVLKLPIHPVDLQPIMVTVKRTGQGWMEGFDERRLRGQGTFITHSEIEQRHPAEISDLLRSVPGARFLPLPRGGYTMRFSDGCRPVIWVNGHRTFDSSWNGTDYGIDRFLSVEDVEAIEVYQHIGDVPAQFGPTSCGAVVIWTRPPHAVPAHRIHWKAVLFGVGVVALGVFLVR